MENKEYGKAPINNPPSDWKVENKVIERFGAKCPGYAGLGVNGDAPIMVKREDALQFILEELAGQREEIIDIVSKKTKVAELKVDENDQLWARIDTIYSGKPKGEILLLDAEEFNLLT